MKIPSLGRCGGVSSRKRWRAARQTVRYSSTGDAVASGRDGLSTVLMYQVADDRIYLDEACLTRAQTSSLVSLNRRLARLGGTCFV